MMLPTAAQIAIFQSAVDMGALVFAVFGLLYSVHASASAMATPENPERPPICDALQFLGRIIGLFMIAISLVAASAASFLTGTSSGYLEPGLAIALAGCVGGLTLVTLWLAFRTM